MSNFFEVSYVELPNSPERLKRINKYLAERRQRVLNKVIAEAIENNEFLGEDDGEFKL